MLAVDTNVLVRILVDDPGAPSQCAAARKLASEAGTIYVPQVVQIETVWVLESSYGVTKSALIDALAALAQNTAFVLQHGEVFRAALDEYRDGRADFSDYVVLAESHSCGAELATFDRKLGGHAGALIVNG